jgi:hypothetical protein
MTLSATTTTEFNDFHADCAWDKKYVIDNLPPWVYAKHDQPKSVAEAKAKISALEHTLLDMDLQIEVRDIEVKIGESRHATPFDHEKWRAKILRAKQSSLYVLNAFRYWLILNTQDNHSDSKFNRLVELLIEDPVDFVEKAKTLLD